MEWDVTSVREAAHALAGTNIVVIADDSGSMVASVQDSPVPPAPGILMTIDHMSNKQARTRVLYLQP